MRYQDKPITISQECLDLLYPIDEFERAWELGNIAKAQHEVDKELELEKKQP